MAIDTEEKRRSAANVQSMPNAPGVTPNVAKDVQWRVQAAWSYSGLDVYSTGQLSGPQLMHTVGRLIN
jgi:hypothetical protein